MLSIIVPEQEFFDEQSMAFIKTNRTVLNLEHSLKSISKWEADWCKPFLSPSPKTVAETVDYIKDMTLNEDVDDETYLGLTNDNINAVNEYMERPMTATWFKKRAGGHSSEVVTSEIIYYWMVYFGIPFECQYWHLNRLLTLIQVCNEKETPSKKMSKNDIMRQNSQLNAARMKAHHYRK